MGGPNPQLDRNALHRDLDAFVDPWLKSRPAKPTCTVTSAPDGVSITLVYPYMHMTNTFPASKYFADKQDVLLAETKFYLHDRKIVIEEEPSHGTYIVNL